MLIVLTGVVIEYGKILSSNEITVIRLPSPFVLFVIPEGRSPGTPALSSRREQREPPPENGGTMLRRKREREKQERERDGWRGGRSSTSVVYSCSIMPRPLHRRESPLRPVISRGPRAFLAFFPFSRLSRFFDTSCDVHNSPTSSDW